MSMSLFPATLMKYRNEAFIETGTYDGRGIILALALGFKKIRSVELDPGRYDYALKYLGDTPGDWKVELDDSKNFIPRVLSTLEERATIWLDAHPISKDDVAFKDKLQWPLVGELRAIAQFSKRKDHTILVDDRHDFKLFGTNDDEVLGLIRAINPAYNARIEANIIVGTCP